MSGAEHRLVGVDCADFESAVALRDRVLRDPLGRPSAHGERDRDRMGRHFVAVQDGAVIGCLALYPEGKRAILRSMAVAPEVQGQGVGASLYRYAEGWAALSGIEAIEAEARSAALAFYVACGFSVEGEEYLGHGIPHRKVKKVLRRS